MIVSCPLSYLCYGERLRILWPMYVDLYAVVSTIVHRLATSSCYMYMVSAALHTASIRVPLFILDIQDSVMIVKGLYYSLFHSPTLP